MTRVAIHLKYFQQNYCSKSAHKQDETIVCNINLLHNFMKLIHHFTEQKKWAAAS